MSRQPPWARLNTAVPGVEEYGRDALFESIDKAWDSGYEAAYHEMWHPWEEWDGPGFVGTRSPTRSSKIKAEQITRGFQRFSDNKKKQLDIERKARAEAVEAKNKMRRSTLKTALVSAALGAAATQGANLYMGANYQPQPPQAHMSFPSRMQQSLADLTGRARGKKRTRRRRKNRK